MDTNFSFKPGVSSSNTQQSVDEKPKRFKMCYVDADTFVVRCSKMLQEDYVEVKHKSSGRVMEFPTVTSFGLRQGKIIELTEDDIMSNKREVSKEKLGKTVKEPYKWLAWKNHDQEKRKGVSFSPEDFELLHKARLNSEYSTFEDAMSTAEMVFASNIKGIKTHMDSEDYMLCISSGNGNYRNQESKTIEYKSSRLEKPIYFKEFKDKIADVYKTKIKWTDNNEAEDLLQHIAKQQEALYGKDPSKWDVCGLWLDKDCNQINMIHKNPDKYDEGWIEFDELYRERTLAAQTISGDPTDTIDGLPTLTESVTNNFKYLGLRKSNGVSKATAEKLLSDCNTKQDMWLRVVYCYQQYYGFDKTYKFKDVHGEQQEWSWLDYMQQCYVLVKMQEYQGQVPSIRGYLQDISVDFNKEILFGKTEIDTEKLVENLEVCKVTLSEVKDSLKSYKSLKKDDLVARLGEINKQIIELEGNLALLEK